MQCPMFLLAKPAKILCGISWVMHASKYTTRGGTYYTLFQHIWAVWCPDAQKSNCREYNSTHRFINRVKGHKAALVWGKGEV